MLLSNLIASNSRIAYDGPDINIAGLTEDSRKIEPGFLFIATPGTKQDGATYIGDAIARGAVAVLVPESTQKEIPLPLWEGPGVGLSRQAQTLSNEGTAYADPIPNPSHKGKGTIALLTAPDIRKATSSLAAKFYPKQPETISAVTGTSGKTSTAQFAREIWQIIGHKSASIGTLGLVTATGTKYGALTTPDAITMHRLLNECVDQGITHAAVEASSHGIELHRLDHVIFESAGFTNLSRDHLDYHQTMEAYLAAKMRLFTQLLPMGATAVLNADIAEYEVLEKAAKTRGLEILSFGRKGKDPKLIDALPHARGQWLQIEMFGRPLEILLPVMGGFQAWNALCAAGMAIGSGEAAEACIGALEKVSGVPGRLQYIGASKKGGAVFVDYAHKPDALENVLRGLRPHVAAHPGAKLGVIFGCGGNRDKGKRPIMGGIAVAQADWVIVTDDNPRHEEASVIRSEILAGITDKKNVKEIGDRAQAIAEGIDSLAAHDVLVIAGKGHEPGQIVGDKVLPFDDSEEARKALGI